MIIRALPRSTFRVWTPIRDMTWPSGRCVATAAWSASAWSGGEQAALQVCEGTSVIILGSRSAAWSP